MNNRDKYIKDDINIFELARNLASYLTEEDVYSIKSLDLSNRITNFLAEDNEPRSDWYEKEVVKKCIEGVCEKLEETGKIADQIKQDGRWWYNHTLVANKEAYTFNVYASKRKIDNKKEEH